MATKALTFLAGGGNRGRIEIWRVRDGFVIFVRLNKDEMPTSRHLPPEIGGFFEYISEHELIREWALKYLGRKNTKVAIERKEIFNRFLNNEDIINKLSLKEQENVAFYSRIIEEMTNKGQDILSKFERRANFTQEIGEILESARSRHNFSDVRNIEKALTDTRGKKRSRNSIEDEDANMDEVFRLGELEMLNANLVALQREAIDRIQSLDRTLDYVKERCARIGEA